MSEKGRRAKAERHRECHALMLRLKAGEKAAFQPLFDRNDDEVRAYAATVVGPEHEDDVDEASSRVWTDIFVDPSIYKDDTADFASWLCVVTRHRSLRIRRERNRHGSQSAALTQKVKDEVRSSEERPDVTVAKAEQRDRLADAMATLSEKEREVARGLFQGKSYGEMSEETGKGISTLKTRAQGFAGKLAAFLGRKGG